MVTTRASLKEIPVKKDLPEITAQMSSHRAISLEIQTNRHHYRAELGKIEKRLEALKYDPIKLERLKDRVRVSQMFDSLEKQWITKRTIIRDLEDQAQFMVRLEELDTQHSRLCEKINTYKETQLFYLKQDENAKSVAESRSLLNVLKLNKQEVTENVELD